MVRPCLQTNKIIIIRLHMPSRKRRHQTSLQMREDRREIFVGALSRGSEYIKSEQGVRRNQPVC